MKQHIVWAPQEGPQYKFVTCPIPEVFYGGSRGGGKTDGALGKLAIKAERYGGGFNALFCRKELPMLDDAIERSHQIYGPIGAEYLEQKKTWRFPSGGRLRFRPLEKVKDADKYQGQNVSDAVIEEAGLYPDPKPIDRLNGILRSAGGVPTQLILTGNPGGPGQLWIKGRYIDPAPAGMKIIKVPLRSGKTHRRIYIPSRVWDNPRLLHNDPEYIDRLHLVGSEELVKAWLEGDWGAIEGAYFDCWSTKLVIRPFAIPESWTKFISFDWGSAKPFSAGWWAIATDDYTTDEGVRIPRGALIRYREWYGMKANEPDTGLKMTAEEVGSGIAGLSRKDSYLEYGVADPAAFAADGGPSIMERISLTMRKKGVSLYWRRADNKRVGRDGHMGGWDQMRERMKREMLFVFSTCKDFIRTVPVLQHDQTRPEDLDTSAEDHAADDARYACMSRPIPAGKPKPKGDLLAQPTLNDLIRLNRKSARRQSMIQ